MEKELLNWLELAKADLLTAEEVLKNKKILPAISVYHSHQCVEKLIKLFLLNKKKDVPKIHNLNKLLSDASSKELFALEDQITELNTYLPKLRYPTGDSLSIDEANRMLLIAKSVYAIVSGNL